MSRNRVTHSDKVQWALGNFPPKAKGIFFSGRRHLEEHAQMYQKAHAKAKVSEISVSLTPVEAMVEKRETEPDYGDF